LLASAAYTQMPAADEQLSAGITDASGVRLSQSGTVIDAVCYAYDAASATPFTNDATYTCEGAPITNNPHNNATNTNVDASIARSPTGCSDTDDNATNFTSVSPANPQSSASPTGP
jgi:hypothetical protein